MVTLDFIRGSGAAIQIFCACMVSYFHLDMWNLINKKNQRKKSIFLKFSFVFSLHCVQPQSELQSALDSQEHTDTKERFVKHEMSNFKSILRNLKRMLIRDNNQVHQWQID